MPERRPACIQNGFGHSGFCKLGGVHIADNDQTIFTGNLGGLFVEVVPPGIGDLGMDGNDTTPIARSLGNSEDGFILAVMLKRWNFTAITERGEIFKTEVDPDGVTTERQIIHNLALEGDIPMPARILYECTSLELTPDLAGFPELEAALEIDRCIPIDLNGARDERNPSERAL